VENKRLFWVTSFLGWLLISLIACGGGGGSSSGISAAPPASNSSMVVTPSLGLINGADVKATKLDGTQLGNTVKTDNSGKATLIFPDYSGPVIVEVAGNATATYFDEALGTNTAFGAGEKLRVALDSIKAQVGVTALTEIALQRAEALAGSTTLLTTTAIQTANEAIRQALASEITDITTPPQLISQNTTSGALDTSNPSKYAAKLAALAKMAKATGGASILTSPALAITKQLADDYKDGVIDGKNGSATVTGTATYAVASMATDLKNEIVTYTASFGNTALQTLASDGSLSAIICSGSSGGSTGVTPTYSISGAVSGAALSGVTIVLSGSTTNSKTTDANGNYSFSNIANGDYMVTPSLTGYTFTPTSRSVTVSGANITGTNFVVAGSTHIAPTCSQSNFTLANYNAIAIGMTLQQVNQTMGCQYLPSQTMYISPYIVYIWYDGGLKMIQVFFDASNNTVTASLGPGGFKQGQF
jgi:hypothetical protein